jgi:hypothetical protein
MDSRPMSLSHHVPARLTAATLGYLFNLWRTTNAVRGSVLYAEVSVPVLEKVESV